MLNSVPPKIKVETTLRGLNQFTKKLAPAEMNRRARASLQECLDDLYGILTRMLPEASGGTKSRIYTKIYGSTIRDMNGVVASPDAHFRVLEYGRRPGAAMPPETPIRLWAEEVGIEVDSNAVDEETGLTGAAILFLIRRSISRNGIQGQHYMRRTLEQGRRKFPLIYLKRFMQDFR